MRPVLYMQTISLDDCFDVTLFEEQRKLGSIWSTDKTYADTPFIPQQSHRNEDKRLRRRSIRTKMS